ncbi:MAG: signal peptidase I [Clostridia bacterium]|nr:signal peptidase I [Clostridia bacterium]
MSRVKEHRAAAVAGRLIERILIVAAIAVVLHLLFSRWMVPVRCNGSSMQPTLSSGDVVLSDRLYRYGRGLRRGDMVAVRSASGELFIRRVVGMPGETADMKEGKIFVNGCPLEEDYLAESAWDNEMQPMTIPMGAYLLLSDDRADTSDSRDPEIGCVPETEILGLVRIRVMPFARFAVFYHDDKPKEPEQTVFDAEQTKKATVE